jgi:hypothetical protein
VKLNIAIFIMTIGETPPGFGVKLIICASIGETPPGLKLDNLIRC